VSGGVHGNTDLQSQVGGTGGGASSRPSRVRTGCSEQHPVLLAAMDLVARLGSARLPDDGIL
jgi:hypothetical protein